MPQAILINGDWSSLPARLSLLQEFGSDRALFDCILAAEVIYNRSNYEKVSSVIQQLLKPEGECLMASKIYYYGVGGCLPEFKEHL